MPQTPAAPSWLRAGSLAIALWFGAVLGSAPAIAMDQFKTEALAQAHCPKDVIVWLNTKTGIYHFRGQRWYGTTQNGAYVCKAETAGVGVRATKNGQ